MRTIVRTTLYTQKQTSPGYRPILQICLKTDDVKKEAEGERRDSEGNEDVQKKQEEKGEENVDNVVRDEQEGMERGMRMEKRRG